MLLVATGMSEVNDEKNGRLNSVQLADEIFEQTRIVMRNPPNVRDLQLILARARVDQMAAFEAEDQVAGDTTHNHNSTINSTQQQQNKPDRCTFPIRFCIRVGDWRRDFVWPLSRDCAGHGGHL